MENNTSIIKKSRSLPRVWKRFYQLKKGETFFTRSDVVAKTSVLPIAFDGVKVLWPWTRVRTTTLVRDALPGGKSGPEPIQPSAETLTLLKSLNQRKPNACKTPPEFSRDGEPPYTEEQLMSTPYTGRYATFDHNVGYEGQPRPNQTGPSA